MQALARQLCRRNAVSPQLLDKIPPASASPALGSQQNSWFSSDILQDDADSMSQLSAKEVHFAAKLARLSGLCYGQPDRLAARLQAEGMQVQAQGQTSFTRWFVATGSLNQPLAAPSQLAHAGVPDRRTTAAEAHLDSSSNSDAEEHQTPSARVTPAHIDATSNMPSQSEHCVILMRGVVWRSEEVEVMKLWQNLLRFWPVTFADSLVQPQGALQAHGGMADMAQELYKQLECHIQQAKTAGQTICFGGHSLGGALATLVCCHALLQLRLDPQQVQCVTFGSPPVLAHRDGKDGNAILQMLGLPSAGLRSYVLDSDPIPRAMLSIDPTFSFFKEWPAVKGLLQMRQWFMGQTSAPLVNPARFLYDNVGEVFLIKWTVGQGHKVQQLAPAQIEEQLKLAVGQLMSRPPAAMQALLDHSHDSYAKDLEAAAKQLAGTKRHKGPTSSTSTAAAQ
ncbi:TPA: hypothetical protein ACH3X3_012346 [Trebouxia sp. C0006]